MTELLSLAIVSMSIIGLIYSLGNIVLTITKPTSQITSFDNLEAYSQGLIVKPKLESVK